MKVIVEQLTPKKQKLMMMEAEKEQNVVKGTEKLVLTDTNFTYDESSGRIDETK
jgi:hypothetical protein